MKEIKLKIFSFSELSETAKDKAISDKRNSDSEYFWTDEWRGTINAFCKQFGITADWSIGGGRYSYARIASNNNDDEVMELSGKRLYTYLVNNYESLFFEHKPYGEYKKRATGYGYKRRSRVLFQKTSCPLTGYCGDESILGPLREFIDGPEIFEKTFIELLESCLDSWAEDFKNDIEYQDSDEFISQELEENEVCFLEDGTVWDE